MRFPVSRHVLLPLRRQAGPADPPFPNPLTEAAGSTVIDIAGGRIYAQHARRPSRRCSPRWLTPGTQALEEIGFSAIQDAIRARDVATLKRLWNELVPRWDGRTFYDFVATSQAFSKLPFLHREMFGLVGFGTGGWDSDFPNSMLEILRVVITNCDTDQRLIVGGVEQTAPGAVDAAGSASAAHWPAGTTLASLHDGAPAAGVAAIAARRRRPLRGHRPLGRHPPVHARCSPPARAGCSPPRSNATRACSRSELWMALDRTRYMQSSKTFVMVDRPFWKDIDPRTGRDVMSMTLTDRLTRGTYLFDNGPDQPGVICLTYSWMCDALKMLPYAVDQRVELSLDALGKIYPDVDIASHIVGDPITVSWEADPHFLGAFKGALPGHYRYNHRMYAHFMQERHASQTSGASSSPATTSPGPRPGPRARSRPRSTRSGASCTTSAAEPTPTTPDPGDLFADIGPIELPD